MFFFTLFKATAAAELFNPRRVEAAAHAPVDGNGFYKAGFFTLASSGATEVAYNSDCELGMGYDFVNQECVPSAIAPVGHCTDATDGTTATCISQGDAGLISDYTQTVSSKKTLDSLISDTASASGSGWGVSVSASASYVSKHSSTSQQVSFYIGQTGQVYEQHIQNPVNLKLTDAAKELLATNPTTFINLYDTHYVYKMTYAATFIGSVDVLQKTSADSTELGVMASISASELFAGSVDVKNTFDSSAKSGSEYLQVTAKALYNGKQQDFTGEGLDAPSQIQSAFSGWCDDNEQDPTTNAVATTMVYRPWTDLEDVQQAISDNPALGDMLKSSTPTALTLATLQKETVLTSADLAAASNILSWPCVATNSDIKSQVQDIYEDIYAHEQQIEMLGAGDLLARQTEIAAGNFDWFQGISGSKVDELNALLSGQTCSQTYSSGDILIQDGKTSAVKFNDAESSFMKELEFTTSGVNVYSVKATGTDIGFRHVTTAASPTTTSNEIAWGKTPQMSVSCADQNGTPMFITGMSVTFHPRVCTCTDVPPSIWFPWTLAECTDGTGEICVNGKQTCENWAEGNTGGCVIDRRRIPRRAEMDAPTTATVASSDAPDHPEYGRIQEVQLHCSGLAEGRYGLPTNINMAADQMIWNEAGKTLTADCPEGYLLTELDLAATNVFDFTLVGSFALKCRSVNDFQV